MYFTKEERKKDGKQINEYSGVAGPREFSGLVLTLSAVHYFFSPSIPAWEAVHIQKMEMCLLPVSVWCYE